MAWTKPIVGIDLGGTNMQIGVVTPRARVVGESKKKTKSDEGRDAIVNRMVEGVTEACAAARIGVKDLQAVGVGAPGAIDPDSGVVLEAVNLRWNNVALAGMLTKRLGVPVFLDNDVNAAIYGEWKFGAAKGSAFCLGVWCGTGIGGGLILNDELYYGHHLTAGEVGHMILLPQNPPGSRSLEHNCSRLAVVERIVKLIRANRKSMITDLCEGEYEKIKSRTLARAYQAGDDLVLEVVDSAAEMLGINIAGIVTLLSLERVVLGGGLVEAIGQPFVDVVDKTVRRFAFPDRLRGIDVVQSKLEDRAGVMGAAAIAADRVGGRARRKR